MGKAVEASAKTQLLQLSEPYVLLIWDQPPESVDLYLIPRTHKAAKWALKCNGVYINVSDVEMDHPVYALNDWICSDASDAESFHVDTPVHIAGETATIIKAGFPL